MEALAPPACHPRHVTSTPDSSTGAATRVVTRPLHATLAWASLRTQILPGSLVDAPPFREVGAQRMLRRI
jgi:hypothetical protein